MIWGLLHGMLLVAERYRTVQSLIERAGPLRHLYVLGVVVAGWVFFRAVDLDQALAILATMAGAASASALDGVAAHLTGQVMAAGVLGLVLSMPIVPWMEARVSRWRRTPSELGPASLAFAYDIVATLCLGAALLGSTAAMAAGGYDPFIYLRF